MAIRPVDEFQGQIDPVSAEYPHGKARNITAVGDGNGTPWERRIANDIFGLQQSLLEAAGITPSGVPDEVGASQYLQAMEILRRRELGAMALDGWEERTIDSIFLQDVAFNGSQVNPLWVAVGGAGSVAYSRNLRDWSTVVNPATGMLESVIYASGNFAAVGADQGKVFYSASGNGGWQEFDVDTVGAVAHHAIGYSSELGLWAIGADDGRIYTAESLTGSWTERNTPTTRAIQALTYVPELQLWVAVANNGVIITSPDAITDWTAQTSGTSSHLNDIAVGRGRILVAGDDGVLLRSDDGVNWTSETVGIPSDADNDHVGVVHDGRDQFLLSTDAGAARSLDGEDWIVIPDATARGSYLRAAYAGGHAFLLGSSGFGLVTRQRHL